MPKNSLEVQLKETSQLTEACWAIWLENDNGWEILAAYKLNNPARNSLFKFLQTSAIEGWLNGALAGKRCRSRAIHPQSGMNGSRLYVFPDQMTQRVILVGAEQLSEAAQRFWRVLALGNSSRSLLDPAKVPVVSIQDLGVPYFLPEVLDRALNLVVQLSESDAGWLAIRSGESFEIRASKNCDVPGGERISIEANPLLRELVQTSQARMVENDAIEWAMTPRSGYREIYKMWAAVPLLIGRRLIGLVAFWRANPFSPDEWFDLQQLVLRLAPSVEASVTFTDLTAQLSRMALLNDFAVSITSSFDPEQIAQRVFALLARAFDTDRINLVILSSDGNSTQTYSNHNGTLVLQTTPLDDVTNRGLPDNSDVQKVDSVDFETKYEPLYPGSRSALIVPLKYRKQLVGKLVLESNREGAFTVYDEHLIMVISSYLAGLLENVRLRREAEDRARNLKLIHEVIEQVLTMTDLKEVCQIAAELMAHNFAYELVGIVLNDLQSDDITLMGVGGSAADLVQQGLDYMGEARKDGIVRRVAVTGESILVNDVSKNPFYRNVPNWDANSEMCVALKDGERTIGVIDVESQRKNAFSQNDLIVLESLAGILSTVMSSAGQYQKLEATVDQLRTAREELQERIVAQRMAESRLVQAAKLAAVGEMAAGIAHELNNPLTSVSGFTELVLEDLPTDSKIRGDLELVLREAQRARSVVRRLLDFARQSESARVRADINEILAEVLALVNHLLRTSGIQLVTEFCESLPWISVDRNQIKQVLLNLIHNAIHAMSTGGELRIRTEIKSRDKRDWLAISLKDTGIGIAPENLDRVFEPFFTTRSRDGGTGLGLSVTYGIVTDHGGLIDVESQVGKGSTFTVWLPIEVD